MADQLHDIVQRMLDAGESEENIAAVIKAYKEESAVGQTTDAGGIPHPGNPLEERLRGFTQGATAGLRGFVRGIVPGAVKGAVGAVTGPVRLAYSALTHPADTATEAVKGVYASIKAAPQAAADALDLAARDPEQFGHNVGEVTGSAEGGLATAAALPMTPKPVVRKTGELLRSVGEKGGWPIRMMGAHQLGSGNLLGIPIMATPEVLKKVGGTLERWGGKEPPVWVGRSDNARALPGYRAEATAAKKASEQTAADAAKAAENQAALDKIEAAKAGLEAQPPAVSESVTGKTPGGGTSRATTRYTPPEPLAPPTMEDIVRDRLAELNARPAASASGRRAISASDLVTGRDPSVPMPPPPTSAPGISIAGLGDQAPATTIEQELTQRAAKVPVQGTIRSTSKRLIPGTAFSEGDAEFLATKLGTSKEQTIAMLQSGKLKAINQDIMKALMEDRRLRHGAHYTNAQLDKQGTSALKRD